MSLRIIHDDKDGSKDSSKKNSSTVTSVNKKKAEFSASTKGQPLLKKRKKSPLQVVNRAKASSSKDVPIITSSSMDIVKISNVKEKEDSHLQQGIVEEESDEIQTDVSNWFKGKTISKSEEDLSTIVKAVLRRNCSFVYPNINENPISLNIILKEVSFLYLFVSICSL